MMIIWTIDTAGTLDGRVDPDDLAGSIEILGQRGRVFDEPVYLSNWFDSLIAGCSAMKLGKQRFVSDLVTEPDPLVFTQLQDKVLIRYGKQVVRIASIQELDAELRRASCELIECIKLEAPEKGRQALKSVTAFLEGE